jgi:hypothetical protein
MKNKYGAPLEKLEFVVSPSQRKVTTFNISNNLPIKIPVVNKKIKVPCTRNISSNFHFHTTTYSQSLQIRQDLDKNKLFSQIISFSIR